MNEWRKVNGYPDYIICSNGDIFGLKRGKLLSKNKDRDGYMFTTLYNNGQRKDFKVARLVAQHFIPNPLNKPQVNHKDGNRSNDYHTNLEWMTAQENSIYTIEVLGHKITEETRKKMSIAHKNQVHLPHSEETKKKMSLAKKGIKLSEEHKKKIGLAMSGEKHPLYGKHHTEESKQKMRKPHKRKEAIRFSKKL